MRYILTLLVLGSWLANVYGQDQGNVEEGTISYVTSQNIYVQFKSTAGIEIGDTLYMMRDNQVIPVLVVDNKSSMSCVCRRIDDIDLKVSDKVITKSRKSQPEGLKEKPVEILIAPVVPSQDTTSTGEAQKKKTQDISGRASISSYLNFSNTPGGNSQRFRYTFSMNARNIANTKLTGECYVSFVQRSNYWDEIKQDIFNGLKIYNFSFMYEFTENTRVLIGRKINPKLSSVGAIDGIQFEQKVKSFTFGIIAGARPDYQDYGFNFNLFQAGAYVSHEYNKGKASMQSTLAFIDQENAWNTDRRFLYLQHYNSLVKNLYFFGSAEIDLYQYMDSIKSTTFNLTNFYLMFRYRVIKQLTLSLTYSARNNVIYYETYKEIVDRLVASSTLQGISFQAQVRPIPKLSISGRAGYRDRKEDPKPSWNVDGTVTYSQVPVVKVSVTGSATYLQTGYTKGKNFAASVSRDIIPGKLYGSVGYRYVDYKFYSNETSVAQNMAEISLNWNIYRKLLFSINYEGTFESSNYKYNRLYINLSQRF